MKKIILAAALVIAASANAQTIVIPPAGFQAEKMNACRKYGEMSAEAYALVAGMSRPTPAVWAAARQIHPIVSRVVDAIQAGKVVDQQAAFQLGMAYCYDYVDEQARKK